MSELSLVVLEEKLAHQEHALGELDAVIVDQQRQLDALFKRCQRLEAHIQRLEEREDERRDDEPPPPHY